jgi:hypothetical protein
MRRSHNNLAQCLKGAGVNPKSFAEFLSLSIKIHKRTKAARTLKEEMLEAQLVVILLS